MAVATFLIITFVFPAIVLVMILVWFRSTKKKVDQTQASVQEKDRLIGLLEKLVATKDSIIDKLKI
jgi:hypothetical protein